VEDFSTTDLVNPIHQAILVGITDDKGPEFFEEVPNREGFFQILAGVHLKRSDEELVKDVFDALRRAAMACPFSKPDHETIERVFEESEAKLTGRPA
jgi:hypothetical protein